MITGISAIVYRKSGTETYYSHGLVDFKNPSAENAVSHFEQLRVDVNLINASDELDLDALKKWQPQYQTAEFKLENGRKLDRKTLNLIRNKEISAIIS